MTSELYKRYVFYRTGLHGGENELSELDTKKCMESNILVFCGILDGYGAVDSRSSTEK